MQEIFIRADAGATIGLGHVVRCIALAEILKDNFSIIFYCRELPEKIKTTVLQQGFFLKMIDSEENFFSCIDDKKIVVTDGYGFDAAYQKQIKEKQAKLVCIDDLHDKEFFADLIINHAPGVNKNNYRAQRYTAFALGVEYALLRSPFLTAAKSKREVNRVETIMICFGGADSKNLTYAALTAATSIKQLKEIHVVAGVAYAYADSLSALIKTDKRIQLHQSLNEKEMLLLMQHCDAAIVPASGILFEVLATGCVAFSGYYVDNQLSIYNGFKALNAIVDMQGFTNMQSVLEQNINKQPSLAKNIIDGLSGTRLLNLFKNLAA